MLVKLLRVAASLVYFVRNWAGGTSSSAFVYNEVKFTKNDSKKELLRES